MEHKQTIGPCKSARPIEKERERVMNKVIFVGFNTEQQAYEGDRALHEMHRDGTLTLYNNAVVVKEANGKVVVRQMPDLEAVGTFGGMITGGLIGLLGGPVGAAVGLGTGTMLGAAFDLTKEGIDSDFVEDAGTRLAPGKAALIAEIDEDWQAPLDARMETLGGKILRQTPTQIEDAYLERSVEAAENDLASLEAEKLTQVMTAQTEKARKQAEKLQAKIAEAKQKVQDKEAALAAKMQAVKDEGAKKIATFEAQKATATAESKALLERRVADVRREYQRRTERLQSALDRRHTADAAV
jgi:uncharacterized membrane protein